MGLEFYSTYYWAKVIHIAFIVAWMAGLLYLPRLFVYHKENQNEDTITKVFKIMEMRLYYYIMYPSMIIAWISGLYLGHILGFDNWLIIKIGFVTVLTAYHILLGTYLEQFKQDKKTQSSRYFRIINEVPFIILFVILILVIMKPFA
jgi:putative membrane protein